MLIRAKQSVCPFESLWPFDLHFPICSASGADNGDSPITVPITKDMFNHGNDFCPGSLIANVLHVNHDRHDSNFNQKRMPGITIGADYPQVSQERDNENDQSWVRRAYAASGNDRQTLTACRGLH